MSAIEELAELILRRDSELRQSIRAYVGTCQAVNVRITDKRMRELAKRYGVTIKPYRKNEEATIDDATLDEAYRMNAQWDDVTKKLNALSERIAEGIQLRRRISGK